MHTAHRHTHTVHTSSPFLRHTWAQEIMDLRCARRVYNTHTHSNAKKLDHPSQAQIFCLNSTDHIRVILGYLESLYFTVKRIFGWFNDALL